MTAWSYTLSDVEYSAEDYGQASGQGNMEMKDPRKTKLALLVIIAVGTLIAGAGGLNKTVHAQANREDGGAGRVHTLDFETYRTRV